MSRAVAYVAHQLSAATPELMAANRENGARWCVWLCRHFGLATVADWIVMSSVLEETEENRAMGLACDFALIERCDLVIHVGGRVSSGMALEAEHAAECDVRVVDLTWLGFEPPEPTPAILEAVRMRLEAA